MHNRGDYTNMTTCVRLMELVRISDIRDSKKLVD